MRAASLMSWPRTTIWIGSVVSIAVWLPVIANVDPGGHGRIELHRAANPHGPHEVDILIVPQMDFDYGSLVVVFSPYDSSSRFRDTIWEGGAHAGDTIFQHYVLPMLESGRFSVGARIEFPHNAEGMLRPAGSPLFVQIEDTAVYAARGGFGPIDRQRIEAELQKMRPKLDSLGIAEATFGEVGRKAPWILRQVQERIGVVDMMMPAWALDSTGSPRTPEKETPSVPPSGASFPAKRGYCDPAQDTTKEIPERLLRKPLDQDSLEETLNEVSPTRQNSSPTSEPVVVPPRDPQSDSLKRLD